MSVTNLNYDMIMKIREESNDIHDFFNGIFRLVQDLSHEVDLLPNWIYWMTRKQSRPTMVRRFEIQLLECSRDHFKISEPFYIFKLLTLCKLAYDIFNIKKSFGNNLSEKQSKKYSLIYGWTKNLFDNVKEFDHLNRYTGSLFDKYPAINTKYISV
jgi:hypothetical protein